ncbi:MAG: transposase [Desulfitobacteriaceae bacterium]
MVDPRGRKPWDAAILFRMHILFFTRPECISFRQMCKELSKPKHQDYRNFLCITGTNVPSHAALSRFRTLLSISDDTINELSKPSLSQVEKMEVFVDISISYLRHIPRGGSEATKTSELQYVCSPV